MNYYPHHIGDFNNATRHLTRIERSIYRDMIELYYDTELPLTLDIKGLCRKLIAQTEEESTAVQQVLNEFFTETEQGWHHARCELEINAYRTSISAKSAAGKASAAKREQERVKRLADLNDRPTPVQQPLDSVGSSVQLTKNQEPRTNKEIKDLSGKPDDPPTKPKAQPSEAFLLWWRTWPDTARKTDRKKCWEKWLAKRYDPLVDQIVAHVELSKKSNEQWKSGFEPAPLTYLNGERWNDGVIPRKAEQERRLVL